MKARLPPFPNMTDCQNWQERPEKAKYDMETFDEVLVEKSQGFMDKAKKDGKPFFVWHNTTRMHVFTFLSQKYQAHDEHQDQLRPGRGRHGANGRLRRRASEAPGRHRRGRQHDRRLHHRQRRRGVHLAGRRHDAVQGHQGHCLSRAASACRASPAGRATSSRAASRTASSPASTGSPPCAPPPAIRTSPTNCSRA